MRANGELLKGLLNALALALADGGARPERYSRSLSNCGSPAARAPAPAEVATTPVRYSQPLVGCERQGPDWIDEDRLTEDKQ